jgi:hypothetical protein
MKKTVAANWLIHVGPFVDRPKTDLVGILSARDQRRTFQVVFFRKIVSRQLLLMVLFHQLRVKPFFFFHLFHLPLLSQFTYKISQLEFDKKMNRKIVKS